MKRRQVLAGLSTGLALGPGCLKTFDSDGSKNASPTDGSEGKTPTASGSNQTTTSRRGTENTTTTDSPSQRVLIDTKNLTTYTNNTGSYSIDYPSEWQLTTSSPKSVRITDPDSPSRMLIRIKDGVASIVPRDVIITTAIQRAKRRYSIEEVTRLNQREITLSNGTPATLVKTQLHRSTTDTVLRGTFLIAHAADTVYAPGIFVPERAVTPSVEQAMTEIVTSLTMY